MKSPHEFLCEMRNTIARGWIQRSLGWAGGPRCPWGAALAATGPGDQEACDGARETLASVVGVPNKWLDIAVWNDALGRTKAEVFAALDEAIGLTAPPPPGLELSVPSEQLVEALA